MFFKDPLTECFFYGIAVKNPLSSFIFKCRVNLEQLAVYKTVEVSEMSPFWKKNSSLFLLWL